MFGGATWTQNNLGNRFGRCSVMKINLRNDDIGGTQGRWQIKR